MSLSSKNSIIKSSSSLVAEFKANPALISKYLEDLFLFIESSNSEYNALTSLQKDYALKKAQTLSKASPEARESMSLYGVPVIIKENIQKTGFPVECASNLLKGYRGQYDATAIQLLEEAGAILIATANMDEFAMGAANENSSHGSVKNPQDTTLVAGGSSGGSAAACALGYAPLTLGSETGGSVRVPAAFCGVFGFKPTYGRVSRYGLVAYSSGLDQISPFARSAQDLDSIMQVMGMPDKNDATSLKSAYTSEICNLSEKSFDNLTIGIPRSLIADNIDANTLAEFIKLEEKLSAKGVKFKDIEIKGAEYGLSAYYVLACAEASSNLARFDGIRYGVRAQETSDLNDLYCKTRSQGFGFEVKKRIMLGTFALSAGYYDAFYGRAQTLRYMLCSSLTKLFEDIDFIYLPTTPGQAFKLGSNTSNRTQEYLYDKFTVLSNLCHSPAISVPARIPSDKLSVGLQFIAAQEKDAQLIAFAHMLETEGLVGGVDDAK